ncbi:hypothetical protein OSB04_020176 [Centaurea solstitialis]|uniref:Uncharacterized protein n=1 Tax=Centaurea solstitialis TaxID=347529 RepID=A0AA38SS71_9ASTR|nr:hypothetical protein OSB04_020176 [Centaurea solstitialis]
MVVADCYRRRREPATGVVVQLHLLAPRGRLNPKATRTAKPAVAGSLSDARTTVAEGYSRRETGVGWICSCRENGCNRICSKTSCRSITGHGSIEDVEASRSYARKTEIANTVTNTNLSLRSILEKDKLTESNFLVWKRNLMIVLRHERKWYEKAPPAKATVTVRNAYRKHSDYLLDVGYLMLATMSPDFRTRLIKCL